MVTFAIQEGIRLSTVVRMIVLIAAVGIAIYFLDVLKAWLRTWLKGITIPLTEIVAIKLRGIPCGLVIDAKIAVLEADMDVSIESLQAHYLSGGNLVKAMQAFTLARNLGLVTDWKEICRLDLFLKNSGKDMLDVIEAAIKPENEGRQVVNIAQEMLK
ncbi:MAG: flotillin-like FloA family protein [Puniceicoccales bacterium]|jgi:uncharacterized protein YqfA (UPF0365 family)|nr:flotillin-like FloA family protein [Puniceicoccales bacterium]